MKSIIIGISFSLIGCSAPHIEKVCYTLEELENSKDSLTAKDYPADFSYVALETTDECLIREIDEVVMTADYFFVLDRMDKVYQFSVNGKFIRQIGRRGHGPEEYGRILSFAVNDSLKRVYLADYHKVLAFDFDGEYIGEYPADFWWKFNVTDDSCFLICYSNFFKAPSYKFMIKSSSGNNLGSLYNSQALRTGLARDWKAVFRLKDQYIFNQQFEDTVYTYDLKSKCFDLRYYFDFGLLKLTDKALSGGGDANDYVYLTDITEDLKYIYVTYKKRGIEKKSIIDKNTGKIYSQGYGILLSEAGIYWWPRWQSQDSVLIVDIPAYYMEKRENRLLDASYFEKEGNPVLIIATVKEEGKS